MKGMEERRKMIKRIKKSYFSESFGLFFFYAANFIDGGSLDVAFKFH